MSLSYFAQTAILRFKVSSVRVGDVFNCNCYRTFTQVSVNWPDTEQMREELDDLQVWHSYDIWAFKRFVINGICCSV